MAKQKEKLTRAQKETTHALIQTYGGNTILPLDSKVWVKVGDAAAEKLVRDLKPDDRVLAGNTKVTVTLEQVKQALLEDDPTYRAAHGLLHVYDQTTKTFQPKLKQFLEHTAKKEGLTDADLQTASGKQLAIEHIKKRLTKVTTKTKGKLDVSRSHAAISEWLSGETLLPSDPKTLRALRLLNRNKFDELFGRPTELKVKTDLQRRVNPLLWAHKEYTGAHQTLTNWVAGFSNRALNDSPKNDEDETPLVKRKSVRTREELATQREIIQTKYIAPIIEQVDVQHAFLRVTQVKPISNATTKTTQALQSTAPTLTKGVLLSSKVNPTEIGIKTTTYGKIEREYTALTRLLEELTAQKAKSYLVNLPDRTMPLSGNVLVDVILAYEHAQMHNTPLSDQYIINPLTSQEVKLPVDILADVYKKFISDFHSGHLDKINNLPEGTMAKVYSRLLELKGKNPVDKELINLDPFFTNLFNLQLEMLTPEAKRKFKLEHVNTPQAKLAQKNINKVELYGISPIGQVPFAIGSNPQLYQQHLDILREKCDVAGIRVKIPRELHVGRDEMHNYLTTQGFEAPVAKILASKYMDGIKVRK